MPSDAVSRFGGRLVTGPLAFLAGGIVDLGLALWFLARARRSARTDARG